MNSQKSKIELSIVSPVFNSYESVAELVKQITVNAEKITRDFEIILVEDGSQDSSWAEIRKCCETNPNVRGIRLSRNFGQHRAITAGLEASRGKYVAVLDCDLQDDPRYLPQLYETAKSGTDIVLTAKTNRAHATHRNFFAWFFRQVFNYLRETPETESRGDIGTYSLISRKVVDAYLQVRECHRHYLMVLGWLGFSTQYIQIQHVKRPMGRSSYNFTRLMAHAIDGITSQSDKLLYLSIKFGFTALLISVGAIAYLIVNYYLNGYKEGWASVMVAILTSTSLILLSLGVVGIYIGKIFDQAKDRPLYIIRDKLGFESHS